MSDMRISGFAFDRGLDGISYAGREAAGQHLPERQELAPPTDGVKAQLAQLLDTPNTGRYLDQQLRPAIANRDLLLPGKFAQTLQATLDSLAAAAGGATTRRRTAAGGRRRLASDRTEGTKAEPRRARRKAIPAKSPRRWFLRMLVGRARRPSRAMIPRGPPSRLAASDGGIPPKPLDRAFSSVAGFALRG